MSETTTPGFKPKKSVALSGVTAGILHCVP
ncbi:MAG: hypothetical protein RI984_2007 [Pseudomonadota bacterium]